MPLIVPDDLSTMTYELEVNGRDGTHGVSGSTISMEPYELKIQLKFDDISTLNLWDEPETLTIYFTEKYDYLSSEYYYTLSTDSLSADLPSFMYIADSRQT